MTGFNLGCIDDIDIFQLYNHEVLDGKNHPLDKNKMVLKTESFQRIKKNILDFLSHRKYYRSHLEIKLVS